MKTSQINKLIARLWARLQETLDDKSWNKYGTRYYRDNVRKSEACLRQSARNCQCPDGAQASLKSFKNPCRMAIQWRIPCLTATFICNYFRAFNPRHASAVNPAPSFGRPMLGHAVSPRRPAAWLSIGVYLPNQCSNVCAVKASLPCLVPAFWTPGRGDLEGPFWGQAGTLMAVGKIWVRTDFYFWRIAAPISAAGFLPDISGRLSWKHFQALFQGDVLEIVLPPLCSISNRKGFVAAIRNAIIRP